MLPMVDRFWLIETPIGTKGKIKMNLFFIE